jgi:Tfp pilus assembly protein PilX
MSARGPRRTRGNALGVAIIAVPILVLVYALLGFAVAQWATR